jgi:protein-tyrosine phosphatase
MARPIKVLFVCLGNICRSPTAEGVFRKLAAEADAGARFEVDSAGTGAWHAGEAPDRRMQRAARARGYTLGGQARAVTAADFARFDHILAMDEENLRTLRERCPAEHQGKLAMFRDHDPAAPGADVPDPYYGGEQGFDEVVSIVERTSRQLLQHLLQERRA